MSRIRVPVTGLARGILDLDEEAARYVVRVHRLRAGDTFTAFDPEQVVEADAVVLTSRRGARCEVGLLRDACRGSDVPVWLLLGVCHGERFEWALRESTALGVTDIVPTVCARSASSGTRMDAKRLARWRRIVVQGARQSGRGDVPTLHEFANVQLALAQPPEALARICLWELATELSGRSFRAASDGVVLFVGPEGGLERDEVELARSRGFEVVSLGSLVLRTETAVVAALGAWRVLRS